VSNFVISVVESFFGEELEEGAGGNFVSSGVCEYGLNVGN
jgi:hypothetical protein